MTKPRWCMGKPLALGKTLALLVPSSGCYTPPRATIKPTSWATTSWAFGPGGTVSNREQSRQEFLEAAFQDPSLHLRGLRLEQRGGPARFGHRFREFCGPGRRASSLNGFVKERVDSLFFQILNGRDIVLCLNFLVFGPSQIGLKDPCLTGARARGPEPRHICGQGAS